MKLYRKKKKLPLFSKEKAFKQGITYGSLSLFDIFLADLLEVRMNDKT